MYVDLHVASIFLINGKIVCVLYTEYVIHTLCTSGISHSHMNDASLIVLEYILLIRTLLRYNRIRI